MAAEQDLNIVIKAKNESKKAFNDAKKGAKKFSKELKDLAKVAGAAAAAIGGFAINEARKFEKSISNINTLFNDTGESADVLAEGMKEILRSVPVNPDELGAGAYNVVSAGITDTSEALKVLKKSSQLAVSGLGTVEEAVNLSTSAINAFGLEGKELEEAFDVLQLTVKSGKTNIAELAQSFGNVAGIAKTAGVSFKELQAATAALTTTGQKASVAQTQLRAAILAIQAPTKDMNELIKKSGFVNGEAMLKSLGLKSSMVAISDAAEGNVEVLKKSFGSVEALGATLSLTGEQGEIFEGIMMDMTDASGVLNEAFEKQNETFDSQFKLLENNLKVVLIEIGEDILPKLTENLKDNNKFLTENKDAIDGLTMVIEGFIFILGLLIGTFFEIGKTLGMLFLDFDEFKNRLSFIGEVLKVNFLELEKAVSKSVQEMANSLNESLDNIGDAFADTWEGISNSIEISWLNIKKFIGEGVNFVIDQIMRLNNALPDFLQFDVRGFKVDTGAIEREIQRVKQLGGGEVAGPLRPFANGGIFNGFGAAGVVNSPTLGLAGEAGPEAIVPLPDGRSIPVQMQGGRNNNIVINITGGVFADADSFADFVSQKIARDVSLQYA